MHIVCRVLALAATVCFVVRFTDGASLNKERRTDMRGTRLDRWYDWPCPQLDCPSTAGCTTIEVVMWVHGSRLCEGCPYCVDRPFSGLPREVRAQSTQGGRFRRSVKLSTDTLPIAQNELCGFVSCPLKRPSLRCSSPSILDGYLHGDKCISCAFCSDITTSSRTAEQDDVNEFTEH